MVFIYPGKSCGSQSFDIDQDFVVYSPLSQPELTVSATALENIEALCFRADYGDGLYTYKKYGGREILIKPRYRLTLTVEKEGGHLLIQSNTAVTQWRFLRSNYSGLFAGSAGVGDCSDRVILDKAASVVPTDTVEEDDENTLVINLKPEDYGYRYCIEARDSQGSRAYLDSNIIASDIRIAVVQEGNMLRAMADQPEMVTDWQAVKTSAGDCSKYSFIGQANLKKQPSFELTRKDHNRYYCFRIRDKHGGYVFAFSPLINMAFYPAIERTTQLDNLLIVTVDANQSKFFSSCEEASSCPGGRA